MNKLPLEDLKSESAPQSLNENILRPKKLSEYIGQKAVAGKLEVFLEAARLRKQPLDHVLLSGPPGLGKTTLAHIIASEMGGKLHLTSGPLLDKKVDLVALLTNLQEGDVLFIDEVHRLSHDVEETLYPAIEDFQVQIILGEGASAQSVSIPLPKFTLVGATTQSGKLSNPFRDRFGIQFHLEFYNLPEMEQILKRSAEILDVKLDAAGIKSVGLRSRGTPRIANRLLARVRDFVEVMQNSNALSSKARSQLVQKGHTLVEQALEFLDVDASGLQPLDRSYLNVLIKQFKGGPAGVEALAASLSEERETLEETVEPYLLKEGFLVRTPRGRMATEKAYQHLGIKGSVSPILGENQGSL